ncbi:MAG: hypothetical protein FVQ80_06090 [Planctomycetes bacterium]|nr:hypothetical protein [Planctomycetota bacterium]
MLVETISILSSFSSPESVGITPASMLWIGPLAASIAIVYKTTKLESITATTFIKECIALFGSIVVFMAATALGLFVLSWIFTA